MITYQKIKKNIDKKDTEISLTMRLQATSQRARDKKCTIHQVYVAAPLCSRLKRGVKRTQKAAPPHHAVAPDSANSRSQVNRVVRLC